ncbi:MAG: hypothetical protein DCC49_10610 [Acidobacteria bacterium]|nr:MAG: hypothetical protein DCC49_10610 [Acidobacteriota bacterium]
MLEDKVDVLGAAERLRQASRNGTLDRICDRLGVRLLGIFGSAARGDTSPDSDLDVCVSFSEKPDELGLIDELTKLTEFDQIDLAVIDNAPPLLRAKALVGIPLYEDEPGRYATTQMAALGEERDTRWMRQLELEMLE